MEGSRISKAYRITWKGLVDDLGLKEKGFVEDLGWSGKQLVEKGRRSMEKSG